MFVVRPSPCARMGCKACDKPRPSCRKGLWSPEEDQKLRDYIIRFGHSCWSTVPVKAGKNPQAIAAFAPGSPENIDGELGTDFLAQLALRRAFQFPQKESSCPIPNPNSPCLLVGVLQCTMARGKGIERMKILRQTDKQLTKLFN